MSSQPLIGYSAGRLFPHQVDGQRRGPESVGVRAILRIKGPGKPAALRPKTPGKASSSRRLSAMLNVVSRGSPLGVVGRLTGCSDALPLPFLNVRKPATALPPGRRMLAGGTCSDSSAGIHGRRAEAGQGGRPLYGGMNRVGMAAELSFAGAGESGR